MSSTLFNLQCEISGYLLRKFKTSCGWQKLWTVFTDFTLFFYKSPDDFTPIASLPLLGYRLESARPAAAAADAQLYKSDVLQLTYKSHVYYFKTDAPVSFERYDRYFLPGHRALTDMPTTEVE